MAIFNRCIFKVAEDIEKYKGQNLDPKKVSVSFGPNNNTSHSYSTFLDNIFLANRLQTVIKDCHVDATKSLKDLKLSHNKELNKLLVKLTQKCTLTRQDPLETKSLNDYLRDFADLCERTQ